MPTLMELINQPGMVEGDRGLARIENDLMLENPDWSSTELASGVLSNAFRLLSERGQLGQLSALRRNALRRNPFQVGQAAQTYEHAEAARDPSRYVTPDELRAQVPTITNFLSNVGSPFSAKARENVRDLFATTPEDLADKSGTGQGYALSRLLQTYLPTQLANLATSADRPTGSMFHRTARALRADEIKNLYGERSESLGGDFQAIRQYYGLADFTPTGTADPEGGTFRPSDGGTGDQTVNIDGTEVSVAYDEGDGGAQNGGVQEGDSQNLSNLGVTNTQGFQRNTAPQVTANLNAAFVTVLRSIGAKHRAALQTNVGDEGIPAGYIKMSVGQVIQSQNDVAARHPEFFQAPEATNFIEKYGYAPNIHEMTIGLSMFDPNYENKSNLDPGANFTQMGAMQQAITGGTATAKQIAYMTKAIGKPRVMEMLAIGQQRAREQAAAQSGGF